MKPIPIIHFYDFQPGMPVMLSEGVELSEISSGGGGGGAKSIAG